MQRSNRICSLNITLVLFILLMYSGVYEVVAQPCAMAPAANLPCKRWTYSFDTNNPTLLKNLFRLNCDDSYGTLTCYWSSDIAACKALIKEHNQGVGPKWTFIKATPVNKSAVYSKCVYKVEGISSSFDDRHVEKKEVDFYPYQSHCETQVNGPYRECSDTFTFCGTTYNEAVRGFIFTTTQKNLIKKINRDNNNQKLKSDLAGFLYPKPANENCIKTAPNDSQMCIEPELLEQTNHVKDKPEVHHVIPKKDRQGCSCGKNSMKNAAVISKQLNYYLLNYPRPQAEITAINLAGMSPYPCSQQVAPSSDTSKNPTRKKTKSH